MKNIQGTAVMETEKGIDWADVHRRLDQARIALELGAIYTPEQRQSILKTRAQELAAELEADVSNESIEIVTFSLASETYGIETAFVREVYPLKDYTALPGTPAFVLGMINVHGQILSVIDLKKFFNLPEKGLGDLNKVIILRSASMEFGILADAILGTQQLFPEMMQPSPATISGVGSEYMKGIAEDGAIILDASKILGDKRIIVHEEIA